MLIGEDGKEYGPYTVDILRHWKEDGSLKPHTKLKDPASGRVFEAREVPALFPTPPAAAPAVSTGYPRPYQEQESAGPLWGVILRSVGALVVFFLFHGFGLIFAGYAMFYAIQIKSEGSKYGVAALVIAGITLLIVVTGWLLRLNGAGV